MPSEKFSTTITSLAPGTIISFGDATELSAFEDLLVAEIDPNQSERSLELWAGRVALKDLIKPPKFNGTIKDIRLEVMADAGNRLMDARDRGIAFGRSGGWAKQNLDSLARTNSEETKGFLFTAVAHSTGRGNIGTIGAEMWYWKIKETPFRITYQRKTGETVEKEYRRSADQANGGISVRGVVSKPIIIEAVFTALDIEAKTIGFEVLRRSLMHPIITPITQ